MNTGLAIGLGAVGLYVLYRVAQAQSAPPPAPRPAPGPPPPRTLEELGSRVATIGVNRTIRAVTELVTGTSGSQFKTFGQQSDFEALSYLMCNCYHQGAGAETKPNGTSCRSVQQMAPGTHCKGGDCDCHPVMTGPGRFAYRDSRGSYTGEFGPKTLATEWMAS